MANNVLDTSTLNVKYPNFANALIGQFTILSTFDSALIKQPFNVFKQCRFSNTLELSVHVGHLINELQERKIAVNDPQIVANAVQALTKSFIDIIIHTLENDYAITNNSLTWSTITNFRQLLGVNEQTQSAYSIDHSALKMPATGWFSSIINWWNKDKILASQLILQNLLMLEIMTHTPFSRQNDRMASYAQTKLSDITGLLQNDQSAYFFKLPTALRQNLEKIQHRFQASKRNVSAEEKQAPLVPTTITSVNPPVKRQLTFDKSEVEINTSVKENAEEKEGISLEELLLPPQQIDTQEVEQKSAKTEPEAKTNTNTILNDWLNTPEKPSDPVPQMLSPSTPRVDAGIVSPNKPSPKKRLLERKDTENTVNESPRKKSKKIVNPIKEEIAPIHTPAKTNNLQQQNKRVNSTNNKSNPPSFYPANPVGKLATPVKSTPQQANKGIVSTTPSVHSFLRRGSAIKRQRLLEEQNRIEASRDTTGLSASKPTPKVKINA